MTKPIRHALAAEYYTEPAAFVPEQERVFRQTWQYAGHVSPLEAPGDYFAFDWHGRQHRI
ncbi:MAG: hypothetical protein GKR94_17780 [Gammaproteobacteria bacterium]|nr:hypothetical protein [Gammaproteobacteria bacterium]